MPDLWVTCACVNLSNARARAWKLISSPLQRGIRSVVLCPGVLLDEDVDDLLHGEVRDETVLRQVHARHRVEVTHSLQRGGAVLSHNCPKSLQGEAPCGSAVYGKVDEMSPAPSPLSPGPHTPGSPPPPDPPCPQTPPHGRQGGQGRIGDITGKGLRTAVALSTASCLHCNKKQTCANRTMGHLNASPMRVQPVKLGAVQNSFLS